MTELIIMYQKIIIRIRAGSTFPRVNVLIDLQNFGALINFMLESQTKRKVILWQVVHCWEFNNRLRMRTWQPVIYGNKARLSLRHTRRSNLKSLAMVTRIVHLIQKQEWYATTVFTLLLASLKQKTLLSYKIKRFRRISKSCFWCCNNFLNDYFEKKSIPKRRQISISNYFMICFLKCIHVIPH